MPELPEVEHLARGLAARIIGSTIEEVRCHFPSIVGPDPECFAEALRGRQFERIYRHGKYLFFLLDGGINLSLHLRMTGQFLLVHEDQPADKHTHLELYLSGRDAKLVYRDVRKFGRFELLAGSVEQFIKAKRLGADALRISSGGMHRLFQNTSRNIKAALLDQRIIAGLGNIYTDEILFRERISPLRKACFLSFEQVASLRRTIRVVLRSAIRKKGTTISDYVDVSGEAGDFQSSLLVYSRAGQPCRTCGTTIAKSRVAGRGTYSCPSCQRS